MRQRHAHSTVSPLYRAAVSLWTACQCFTEIFTGAIISIFVCFFPESSGEASQHGIHSGQKANHQIETLSFCSSNTSETLNWKWSLTFSPFSLVSWIKRRRKKSAGEEILRDDGFLHHNYHKGNMNESPADSFIHVLHTSALLMVNNVPTILEELTSPLWISCWILMCCFKRPWVHAEESPLETSCSSWGPAALHGTARRCGGYLRTNVYELWAKVSVKLINHKLQNNF